jgi:hypothetical protein
LLKGILISALIYLLGYGFTIEKEEKDGAQIEDEENDSHYMADLSYTQVSGQNMNTNRGLCVTLM